jgi:hypothetical protein
MLEANNKFLYQGSSHMKRRDGPPPASEVVELLEEDGSNVSLDDVDDVMDTLWRRDISSTRAAFDDAIDTLRYTGDLTIKDQSLYLLTFAGAGGMAGIAASALGHPGLTDDLVRVGAVLPGFIEMAYGANRKILETPAKYKSAADAICSLTEKSSDVEVCGLEESYDPVPDLDDVKTYTHPRDGDLYYAIVDPVNKMAVSGRVDDWETEYDEKEDDILGYAQSFGED